MRTPRHLWSGDWREESARARREAEEAANRRYAAGPTPPAPLPALPSPPIKPKKGQTRAGAIYAAASPAVVSIRTGTGSGTGFLVDKRGRIVTNAHVVDGNKRVLVRFGQEQTSLDGK